MSYHPPADQWKPHYLLRRTAEHRADQQEPEGTDVYTDVKVPQMLLDLGTDLRHAIMHGSPSVPGGEHDGTSYPEHPAMKFLQEPGDELLIVCSREEVPTEDPADKKQQIRAHFYVRYPVKTPEAQEPA